MSLNLTSPVLIRFVSVVILSFNLVQLLLLFTGKCVRQYGDRLNIACVKSVVQV